ncbi:MAG: hypothetical protein AB1603_06690 [Chloroflexota bacterium]
MGRPWWQDSYWKRLQSQQSRRVRSTCPFCGSDKVYYNERFRVWRCGACERSFSLKGMGGGWWRRMWGTVTGILSRLGTRFRSPVRR